jgi:N-acetylglucosamine-6-phosphate deacetylase
MDGTIDAFLKIAETHAQFGTTAMLPTTLTSSKEEIIQTLNVYEDANRNKYKRCTISWHAPGRSLPGHEPKRVPRIQDISGIRIPDEYIEILARSSCIRRWSAAPELAGAIEFGRCMRSKGILPALAHTDAIYEEVIVAFENGFTLGYTFVFRHVWCNKKKCFSICGCS